MADLFTVSKTYRPRRVVLSADVNTEMAAITAAFNTLGQAPAAGRSGVSTAFSIADATETYHAVTKSQLDAATSGFSTLVVSDANYTVTTGVPVDLLMTGRTTVRTVTLPQNPVNGQYCKIRDMDNDATTYAITIARNTRNINGAAADLSLDIDGAALTLVYDLANTNWVVADVHARGAS